MSGGSVFCRNPFGTLDRLTSAGQTSTTRHDSSDWIDSKEFERTRLQVLSVCVAIYFMGVSQVMCDKVVGP